MDLESWLQSYQIRWLDAHFVHLLFYYYCTKIMKRANKHWAQFRNTWKNCWSQIWYVLLVYYVRRNPFPERFWTCEKWLKSSMLASFVALYEEIWKYKFRIYFCSVVKGFFSLDVHLKFKSWTDSSGNGCKTLVEIFNHFRIFLSIFSQFQNHPIKFFNPRWFLFSR